MDFLKRFWPWIRDIGLIVIGSLAQAIGLRLFLIPAHLASGGVSGISQLINYFTGWPIGLMVFIGNVPLFHHRLALPGRTAIWYPHGDCRHHVFILRGFFGFVPARKWDYR